jgi:hypothetical protein
MIDRSSRTLSRASAIESPRPFDAVGRVTTARYSRTTWAETTSRVCVSRNFVHAAWCPRLSSVASSRTLVSTRNGSVVDRVAGIDRTSDRDLPDPELAARAPSGSALGGHRLLENVSDLSLEAALVARRSGLERLYDGVVDLADVNGRHAR